MTHLYKHIAWMVGGQVLKGPRKVDWNEPSPSARIQTVWSREDGKPLVNIQVGSQRSGKGAFTEKFQKPLNKTRS